jgi:hypothetical protein
MVLREILAPAIKAMARMRVLQGMLVVVSAQVPVFRLVLTLMGIAVPLAATTVIPVVEIPELVIPDPALLVPAEQVWELEPLAGLLVALTSKNATARLCSGSEDNVSKGGHFIWLIPTFFPK